MRQAGGQPTQQISEQASTANQLAKAVTAFAAGGTILILSALILTLTVISLAVAVPLLVIFSPVIVPAAITGLLVMGGFMASGGLGVSAIYILSWLYRYLTGGEHPIESDTAMTKIGGGVGIYRDQLTPQD